MRRIVVGLSAGLLVLSGCSIGFGGDPDDQRATDAGKEACADVRAGVSAFNDEDFETTVQRFQDAVAPAEELARLTGDREADDLLEAIRYYADLRADEYADAFATPEFQRYKTITLGLCGEGEPGDDSAPPTQST